MSDAPILVILGLHHRPRRMTVLPETDVLSPVDPKLHPDDWPIHHLKKINVISQQTQQSVSLLESHKDHAVQVTGILDAVDSLQGRKSESEASRCCDEILLITTEQSPRENGGTNASRSPMLASGPSQRRSQTGLSVYGLPERLDGLNFTILFHNIKIYSVE